MIWLRQLLMTLLVLLPAFLGVQELDPTTVVDAGQAYTHTHACTQAYTHTHTCTHIHREGEGRERVSDIKTYIQMTCANVRGAGRFQCNGR